MHPVIKSSSLIATSLVLVVAAGCSTQQPAATTQGTTSVQPAEVVNVRDVTTAGGQPRGVGSLIGGLLGGLAGNAVGNGYGRTIATVGGSIDGSVAGHEEEKAGGMTRVTEVTVRLADGSLQTHN